MTGRKKRTRARNWRWGTELGRAVSLSVQVPVLVGCDRAVPGLQSRGVGTLVTGTCGIRTPGSPRISGQGPSSPLLRKPRGGQVRYLVCPSPCSSAAFFLELAGAPAQVTDQNFAQEPVLG